jgi:hypothetical protein
MKNVIYGDTDSAYISIKSLVDQNPQWTEDDIIRVADEIGTEINNSFPEFMDQSFFIGKERGSIIQAGREVVARRGLFKDVKKRYALHVINLEGKPTDKMKIMGMEVRRSDTPKIIQQFLEECIKAVVRDGKDYDEVYQMVQDFRIKFRSLPPWDRGTPCRVSKLTDNSKKINRYEIATSQGIVGIKKPSPHYSVTAANNTNRLIDENHEHGWDFIRDGDKIEILYLRSNVHNMKSVAIGVDSKNYIPDWFKELPFDNEKHEQKMIDKKIENVLGSILNWDFKVKSDFSQEIFEEVEFF